MSNIGGNLLPFTVGHPFKQGEIPSGQYIVSNLANFQAEVRNRWQDGSIKFAVLSGRHTLIANTPSTIVLSKTVTPPGGVNISEPTPAYLGTNISVTVTGAGAGTYTPLAAATTGLTTWNRSSPHKVREFLGPVMSEFHYYTPTSDTHLTIWWYVRVYSDRMEIETAIEQGWTKVASPAQKNYNVAVNIGGTQRYSADIGHLHHTRWSRRDWIGNDPQISPAHDRAYLSSTKLIPNFAPITVATSNSGSGNWGLSGYVQSAAPMTRGNFEQDGTAGGFHAWLGIMPEWDAAYAISGDIRAYRGMLANEQASNCCGLYYGPDSQLDGYGFVQRDESTGLPAAPTDYVNESYNNRFSGSGGTIVVGSNTSTWPWVTDQAHSWLSGYMAYLATGRWFSLETCQHQVATEFLVSSSSGGLVRCINVQDRAAAWMIRTMAAALAITPDSGNLRSKYISYVESNIAAWRTSQVGFNSLGLRRDLYDNPGPASYQGVKMFMNYFLTFAFAFARDIAADALSATAQTQFRETVQFHCAFPAGLLGNSPSGFSYRRAAAYEYVCGPTPGAFYPSFGAMYDACVTAGEIPSGEASSGTLLGGYFPDATSYWGNFLPAAAYAVDTGIAGAAEGYARMTSASNWGSLYANLGNAPQFAIIPR